MFLVPTDFGAISRPVWCLQSNRVISWAGAWGAWATLVTPVTSALPKVSITSIFECKGVGHDRACRNF